MATSRRQLLMGLGAAAIAPMVPFALPGPAVTLYNEAPANLEVALSHLEGMSRTLVADLFYGTEDVPRRFEGLERAYT